MGAHAAFFPADVTLPIAIDVPGAIIAPSAMVPSIFMLDKSLLFGLMWGQLVKFAPRNACLHSQQLNPMSSGRLHFAIRPQCLSIVTGFRLLADGSATPHLVGPFARTSSPIRDSPLGYRHVTRDAAPVWRLAHGLIHWIRLTSR